MDVDRRIAIPRQPPVLQEHQPLVRVLAFFMTCGGRRGAHWSVIPPGQRLHDALSGHDLSDAAGQLLRALSSRGARPAHADRSAHVVPSGQGASGPHRRRCGSSGVRG